jgi:two-component system, cell cycle sensor histidine kinase and response regulator CckA
MRVLLVEDSESDARLILRELERGDVAIASERVDEAPAMREALAHGPWDLIVADWTMPRFSAPLALEVLREAGRETPFIIVSGSIGEEKAIEAVHAGASDYVQKDNLQRLRPAVDRVLREHAERAARRQAEEALRKSEEQLRQAQKMEAVGRLAGGVAHDFNNLLSIILSYAELAIADLGPGHPVLADIEEIRTAGKRATNLTRQLLAFSRRQVLQPKRVDLNEIVAGTGKMLGRLLGEDVDITTVTAPHLALVEVDSGQIEQVLMNLAVNARDAMPGGGRLTIRTESASLDERFAAEHVGTKPGPHVALSIHDTGSGMDEATKARVFEPFFTTKEVGQGTGLGLSTVLGIVQQSGGSIFVESEVGHGTTFTIYLPGVAAAAGAAAAGAAGAGQPSDPPSPPERQGALLGSETILLVEDEERLRLVTSTVLRRYGYKVLEAQSGGDALVLCEQHRGTIHLLLTDVIMPRMSGKQLAERLSPTRPAMLVLYMSGYTDGVIARQGVLEPGTAFLQKPITPEVLARKVREVLDRKP